MTYDRLPLVPRLAERRVRRRLHHLHEELVDAPPRVPRSATYYFFSRLLDECTHDVKDSETEQDGCEGGCLLNPAKKGAEGAGRPAAIVLFLSHFSDVLIIIWEGAFPSLRKLDTQPTTILLMKSSFVFFQVLTNVISYGFFFHSQVETLTVWTVVLQFLYKCSWAATLMTYGYLAR